jgi:hypothetical protein
MKPNLMRKINRRRLLTTLTGGGAALIARAANAAPEPSAFRFTSTGDAVIVTGEKLVAADPGRPTIAELQRRLDHALRDHKVRDYIAGAPSRYFALSSVTLKGPFDSIACLTFQSALKLQSQIAGVIFGDADDCLATNYTPFYIATAIEDNQREVFGPVMDILAHTTCSAGFWCDAKIVSPLWIFSAAEAVRRPGALDLIALWPFQGETQKL